MSQSRMSDMEIISWLNNLNSLCQFGQNRKAIKEILDLFLSIFEEKDIELMDRIFVHLKEFGIGVLDLDVELAFLSITSKFNMDMPARDDVRLAIKNNVKRTRGLKDAYRLLLGI